MKLKLFCGLVCFLLVSLYVYAEEIPTATGDSIVLIHPVNGIQKYQYKVEDGKLVEYKFGNPTLGVLTPGGDWEKTGKTYDTTDEAFKFLNAEYPENEFMYQIGAGDPERISSDQLKNRLYLEYHVTSDAATSNPADPSSTTNPNDPDKDTSLTKEPTALDIKAIQTALTVNDPDKVESSQQSPTSDEVKTFELDGKDYIVAKGSKGTLYMMSDDDFKDGDARNNNYIDISLLESAGLTSFSKLAEKPTTGAQLGVDGNTITNIQFNDDGTKITSFESTNKLEASKHTAVEGGVVKVETIDKGNIEATPQESFSTIESALDKDPDKKAMAIKTTTYDFGQKKVMTYSKSGDVEQYQYTFNGKTIDVKFVEADTDLPIDNTKVDQRMGSYRDIFELASENDDDITINLDGAIYSDDAPLRKYSLNGDVASVRQDHADEGDGWFASQKTFSITTLDGNNRVRTVASTESNSLNDGDFKLTQTINPQGQLQSVLNIKERENGGYVERKTTITQLNKNTQQYVFEEGTTRENVQLTTSGKVTKISGTINEVTFSNKEIKKGFFGPKCKDCSDAEQDAIDAAFKKINKQEGNINEIDSNERYKEAQGKNKGVMGLKLGDYPFYKFDRAVQNARKIGAFNSLFNSQESVAAKQREVDEMFRDFEPSGWASQMCEKKLKVAPQTVAFVRLPDQSVTAAATIAAECSPPIVGFNTTEHLYKITGFISNPLGSHPLPLKYQIRLSGDNLTNIIFDQNVIEPGQSMGLSGENAQVIFLEEAYDEICIDFDEPPPMFEKSSICNRVSCSQDNGAIEYDAILFENLLTNDPSGAP